MSSHFAGVYSKESAIHIALLGLLINLMKQIESIED
jgi:hypothetical protein